MPSVIRVPDLRSGYVEIVKTIVNHGIKTAPRGQPTRELLDVIIELENPYDALPTGVGRRLNTAVGLIEAIQLIGEISIPATVLRLVPSMSFAAEDDGTFWGAYGRRAHGQTAHVVRKLQEDPDSRQAKITFWDPVLDNLPGKRDYPCTSELRFLIRDGKLIVSATMRSNDAWLGLAYDAFQFTQVQISVARALGIEVGAYHHHACSLHVYERDLDAIERLHTPETAPSLYWGIGRDGDSISTITSRARRIACGDRVDDPTWTETVYMESLI